MSAGTLADYLGHIQQAADNACAYVEGLCKKDFLADRRTQDAVVLSVFIIGEAAARIMDQHPAFVARHPDLPWRSMRGMRNRIAAISRSIWTWSGKHYAAICRSCASACRASWPTPEAHRISGATSPDAVGLGTGEG